MARKRRTKQKNSSYSFLNVLTGSDLSTRRLAVMKTAGKENGPVIWLTGGVHGDEVGGVVTIQEIFKELQKAPLLKGTVYAMPLMNPIGFESGLRALPLSEEDLNRSFPGDKTGSLAERIGHTIFTTIVATKPSLVLDLHNDWSASIPYTLIDPYPGAAHKDAYEKVKELASGAGFPVINEREQAEDIRKLEKTLSGSLLKEHIPSFTFELGGAYVVNEIHVRSGIEAIWNILAKLGMVAARENIFAEDDPKQFYSGKILRYSHEPRADKSGILRFMVKPGDMVKVGDPVARIYNVFGKLQSTLVAEKDGILLGHADSSVAYPGAEILAFGTL